MKLYNKSEAPQEVLDKVSAFFRYHRKMEPIEQVPNEFYFIDGDHHMTEDEILEHDRNLYVAGTFYHRGTLLSKNNSRLSARAFIYEGGVRRAE